MDFSDYSPYKTFDEYTIETQRIKHREVFVYRRDRIYGFLLRIYKSSPGLKVSASYIVKRYNAERFEKKEISIQMVSRCIASLRFEGFMIHHDSNGYWYSENKYDLVNTIINFEQQIYALEHSKRNLFRHITKEEYESLIKLVLSKRKV
jgi:hypothetical protein